VEKGSGDRSSGRKYAVGFITLISTVIALLITIWVAKTYPAEGLNWIIYPVFLLIGFVGTTSYAKRIGFYFADIMNSLVWGGATFAVMSLVQIPFYLQLGLSSMENTIFVLLAPVAESLFFSGVVFGLIITAFHIGKDDYFGFTVASTPSAVGFAIFHYGVKVLSAQMFLILFTSGMILNLSYWKTRNMDIPVMAHFINNAVALIV
jgi:membrane protease YdiL (CAAX protease family)